jgi:rhodanese-related sulfurtransferase
MLNRIAYELLLLSKIHTMQKYLLILILLTAVKVFSQTKVDNTRFKELMLDSTAVILDVRTANEVLEGKILGSLNVSYFANNFLSEVERMIPKDRMVLVYCAAGGRSAEACKLLKKAGYKQLYDLQSGYNGWE